MIVSAATVALITGLRHFASSAPPADAQALEMMEDFDFQEPQNLAQPVNQTFANTPAIAVQYGVDRSHFNVAYHRLTLAGQYRNSALPHLTEDQKLKRLFQMVCLDYPGGGT